MTRLYLDIETIPAQIQVVKDRIAAMVKPPSTMKKADTIAAWEADQKPQAIADAVAKTSFDGGLGHVCCIGYAIDNDKARSIPVRDIEDEKEAIEELFEFVSAKLFNTYQQIQIVGHHVAGFDIRFLTQRAIVLGIRLPSWWPVNPKPWSNEVFDTMTAWAGPRDTISMDNLCSALGLPGKGDIDGSMVAQMFADGKHMEIADYCREDVERTRAIHRKMMVAFEGVAA